MKVSKQIIFIVALSLLLGGCLAQAVRTGFMVKTPSIPILGAFEVSYNLEVENYVQGEVGSDHVGRVVPDRGRL